MNNLIVIAFLAYISVLLFIGFISHKKQRTAKDFLVGNRSLSYWVTAFSAHASDMSGWLFMAFPAAVFLYGVPAIWIAIGLVAGMLMNWQFVAQKLRVATEETESYTVSSFLENHFKDTSGIIRILTAVMTVFFITCYIAAGLIAMGLLLESLFGMNYYLSLSIAMFVATTYTTVGGYYTVAKVDQFQAIFLMIMIILVPAVAYFLLPDGFSSIKMHADANNIPLTLLKDTSFTGLFATFSISFGWGLGYFGQPHIITKFMGIKCPDEIRKSKYVGMTWQVITLLAAACIGLIGIAYFNATLKDPQLVFVDMVHSIFPPLIAGVILCAVLAANISTMDSQIIVSASVLSEDFYKHMFKRHASQKELLLASRISVLIISITSLAMAFVQSSSILEAVHYAWSGLGCSLGPVIIMALYFKRCNRYGAMAGIFTGGIIAGGWHFVQPLIPHLIMPSMIPGFFLSLLAIYTVSLLTAKCDAKTQP